MEHRSCCLLSSLLRTWVFFQILSIMARRPRSSRAWHFVLSAAHRDADARAVALAGTTNWGYDSDGQHSDSDSDPESSALPPPIPSAVPVTGESFCDCDGQSEAPFCSSLHSAHRSKDKDCRCGEEDEREDLGGGPGARGGVSPARMPSSPPAPASSAPGSCRF